MNIDGNIIPLALIGVGFIISIIVILSKYKTKVEQIRADALVRAEEVKAKNQLELEKLLYEYGGNSGESSRYREAPDHVDVENRNAKSRVRE